MQFSRALQKSELIKLRQPITLYIKSDTENEFYFFHFIMVFKISFRGFSLGNQKIQSIRKTRYQIQKSKLSFGQIRNERTDKQTHKHSDKQIYRQKDRQTLDQKQILHYYKTTIFKFDKTTLTVKAVKVKTSAIKKFYTKLYC